MFHKVTDIKFGDYITMQDDCGCCIVTKRVLFTWYEHGFNNEPMAYMGMSYFEDDPNSENWVEDKWKIDSAKFVLNRVEQRNFGNIQYWEQTVIGRPEHYDSPEGW